MAETPPSDRRGEPLVALLLTWFLPGAGHVYLGRLVPGLVAFVVVEGLYVAGWLLSGGRAFEFLDPELQGPLATLLTPEVGNLGGMVAQLKYVGFGSTPPTPFPAWILTGAWLTALSGMANVFLMVSVHLQARTPSDAPRRGPSPVGMAMATFLVPGLGHVLQGRRRRGIIVFVLLVGFFLWGTWLADGSNLSRARHFYYWSGQFLLGLPAFLAEAISGRPPVTGELPTGDVGLLFACMPGLLNVLAMLDVFGVAEKRWLGLEDAASAAEEVEA